MKPLRKHPDLSWRGSVRATVFALLLGFVAGAAAEEFRIGGTGAALGHMRLLADGFRSGNPGIQVSIAPSLGSGGGVKALVAGALDLAVISRPLEEKERVLDLTAVEYARTPFVFAVSSKSRVSEITLKQLVDIYEGKMSTWPDGSKVRVVLRPKSDIDTEILMNISSDMRRARRAADARPGMQMAMTDQDAANDIERIPGAIGPTTLGLIMSEGRALRPIGIDGIEPTLKNAASGAYPYHKQLFIVTGAKPRAVVSRFVAFVRSTAGRKILADNGLWVP